MPRVKQDPAKTLSREEQKQLEALEREYDKELDHLLTIRTTERLSNESDG